METVLEENKGYEHGETRRLLEEVRELVQGRLRLVVPEYAPVKTEADGRDPVEAFRIAPSAGAIYADCRGAADLERILDAFEEKVNELLDNFDDILNKNDGLDEESRRNLENYAKAADKCVNVYEVQRRRRMARFRELSTVEELQEELRLLFTEIIGKYVIESFCDALYERLKNNAGPAYLMVLGELNGFLAGVGVHTKPVEPGEPMDPEWMEPTPDSAENFTEDFRRFDTVDKVFRYPYVFADGAKITDGRVRIWRRKD